MASVLDRGLGCTVVRGRSFRDAPQWSGDQARLFDFIREQMAIDCVWDLHANMQKRRCFLSGGPGTGKSEVLVHVAKLVVDLGGRVLFLAPTGALVHSYLDRLPDSQSIFVDTVHAALRFSRERDRERAKCNPPSRLKLFDVILLDEVSMLEEEVFEALFRHVQELPQRPIFVAAGDFAQLEAIDRNMLVRNVCEMFASQFELTTVHRSKDPKHLRFVSAIREAQPSREQIKDYFDFGTGSCRFLTADKTLDEWVAFGMEQQRLHDHPFVWICNNNRGVARVSLAALRGAGIDAEEILRDGHAGDPAVKCTLPIIPRVGVWIRLTRNLEKERGFVNGALGRIEEVFQNDRDMCIFSLRLISGTMVMVYPVEYKGRTFLPCAYGYGCTVRRTQGLSLHHGALYFDGRHWPRPRGHAYVAVSRFRRADGVFHYGPLRRSDWLPTAECEGEQVRPGDHSPPDWDTDSEVSEDEHGGFAAHYGSDSDGDEAGDLGAHFRSSRCGLGEGSESGSVESEDVCAGGFRSSMCGLAGGSDSESEFGVDEEDAPFGGGCPLDLESEPDDLAAAEFRCAEPDPLPVLGDSAGRRAEDDVEEPSEGEELSVDPALFDCSSDGFARRHALASSSRGDALASRPEAFPAVSDLLVEGALSREEPAWERLGALLRPDAEGLAVADASPPLASPEPLSSVSADLSVDVAGDLERLSAVAPSAADPPVLSADDLGLAAALDRGSGPEAPASLVHRKRSRILGRLRPPSRSGPRQLRPRSGPRLLRPRTGSPLAKIPPRTN